MLNLIHLTSKTQSFNTIKMLLIFLLVSSLRLYAFLLHLTLDIKIWRNKKLQANIELLGVFLC